MKDGTITFTDQWGPVINRVLDLKWTHVLIWLNGVYYEATFPRVCKSKAWKGHTCLCVDPLPGLDLDAMLDYANSQLGRIYQFRGFFNPKTYGKTRGIYCSQYVEYILRAGGADIPHMAGYSPDRLLKEIRKLA